MSATASRAWARVAGSRGPGIALLVILALLAPAPASAATTVSGTPLKLMRSLDRKPEKPAGYDRALFTHWVDADGDGCDTRREVLIAESRTSVTVGPGCSIAGGEWFSAYDGVVTTNASTFDIDHVVALKEAWDSGARRWSAMRRRNFANDLGDKRSLRAVSASSNRSKSDRDPAQWLPPGASFRCQYVTHWVVVKVRWRLSVDGAERRAIRDVLEGCKSSRVRVKVR